MSDLKQELLELPEVKRLKELEKVLDQNVTLQQKIKDLKLKQKQMVHAKEFKQEKQYKVYFDEYQNMYQDILYFPFMEEYLELLEEVNQILLEMAQIIEQKINHIIL